MTTKHVRPCTMAHSTETDHDISTFLCRDISGGEYEVAAKDAESAAREYVEGGDYLDTDEPRTVWISVHVVDVDDPEDDGGTVEIQLDPPEPCPGQHDWQDVPDSVRGSGGGVTFREKCANTGWIRVTDTWATNPENGSQGHTSIRYIRPE